MTIIGVALALILSFSVWGKSYADETTNLCRAETIKAEMFCRTNDTEKAQKSARRLTLFWNAREPFLSLYVRHDELDRVGDSLSALTTRLSLNDNTGACVLLSQIRRDAETVSDREQLNLDNLF